MQDIGPSLFMGSAEWGMATVPCLRALYLREVFS